MTPAELRITIPIVLSASILNSRLIVVVGLFVLRASAADILGYVDCSLPKGNTNISVFSNTCTSEVVTRLQCGAAVKVLAREGSWLKVALPDGGEGYVGAASLSQQKDKFIPLDVSGGAGKSPQDCISATVPTKQSRARLVYSPEPEYTKAARKAKFEGAVTLKFTVGVDGKAHDVTVLHSVGYGLDENAVAAVQQWRWEPASDGEKLIESKIVTEITFKITTAH
jgi:TonB family protein